MNWGIQHLQRRAILPRNRFRESRLNESLELCDGVTDVAILGILFFAPLVMGGRHPIGKLVYLILVSMFVIAWLVRQALASQASYRATNVGWLIWAALLLALIPLIPLPQKLIVALSPFQATLLPAWSESSREISFGHWNRLSLAPFSTRAGVVTFVAHAALFLIAVQWLKSWQKIERLLRWIALATIAMAAVGFVQYISRTEKFAWLFIHPSREAHRVLCGPFANSNHFSHFLALGIGPLLWWLHKSWRDQSTRFKFATRATPKPTQFVHLGLAAALALIAVSSLLARSRGGMLVMFLACVLAVFLLARKRMLSKKSLAVAATVGALAVVALTIHGRQQVASEISSLTSISLDEIDRNESRRHVWAANLEAIRHFPICGTGVGSHAEIYRRFFPHPSDLEYTHAESGYLQVLTETGLPGFGLLLIAIATCVVWSWKLLARLDHRHYPAAIAVATGLAASVIHSVFDFVWFLPACMSVTVLLAACACRMLQWLPNGGDRKQPCLPSVTLSQPKWMGITVIAAALFIALVVWQWPAAYAAPAWDRYLRLSLSAVPLTTAPDNQLKFANGSQTRLYRDMAGELETVLKRYPRHPRANIRLASIRMRLFEEAQLSSVNAMGLASIRDAAIASRFSSKNALDDWLNAALGDNRLLLGQALQNARVGVSGCPVLGKGYIYLAQLAFLEGISDAGTQQLLSQAYSVRPYDGAVLYAIGQDAALRGDVEKALSFWKRSFHQDVEFRNAIINTLAAGMQVNAFLQYFEPDEFALKSLLQSYITSNQVEKTRVVAEILADHIVRHAQDTNGAIATRHWTYAAYLYRLAGDDARCLQCAHMAVSTSPFSLQARRTLALELYRQNDWKRAIRELKWCLRRKPSDVQFQRMLAMATRTDRQASDPIVETISR